MLVFDIDLDKRNNLHCKYLIGLGYMGLGEYETSEKYLAGVLEEDINHQGAAIYLRMKRFIAQARQLAQQEHTIHQ
jgi:hypothetical protein